MRKLIYEKSFLSMAGGDKDLTSRRMLEDILATEEKHADELADWSKRQ
jgi:bacterioferritin (cytochrome b1)